jgi:hypothetical protein
MESSHWQATLGKLAMGVMVTDVEGRRISFGTATGRFLGKFLSSLLLGVGYIIAIFSQKKQTLHDMLSDCVVTRKPTGQPVVKRVAIKWKIVVGIVLISTRAGIHSAPSDLQSPEAVAASVASILLFFTGLWLVYSGNRGRQVSDRYYWLPPNQKCNTQVLSPVGQSSKKCPECSLVNPSSALICDCGRTFASDSKNETPDYDDVLRLPLLRWSTERQEKQLWFITELLQRESLALWNGLSSSGKQALTLRVYEEMNESVNSARLGTEVGVHAKAAIETLTQSCNLYPLPPLQS